MFDQFVYTDCRAGQGLGGGGGLQFQACTEGLPEDALRAAMPSAIYKVHEPWMLTAPPTPADRYPRYSVHLPLGGRWYTGRGRYLGRAVASAREGNHLTHILTTTSAEDYTHFRPAEVCSLPVWRETPAPEQRMPGVELRAEDAPLGIAEAVEIVRRTPHGPDHLAAIVTAMEDPDLRVAIRTDSEQEALAWFLAITAQFPITQSLEIGFEAFVGDPYASPARLVGVYASWSRPFGGRRTPRLCAVDLVEGTINVDGTDPDAEWTVRQWCDGRADDVDDALDLLDSWGMTMSAAAQVAVNAVGLGRPLETTEAVEKYLTFLEGLAPEILANNQRSLAAPLLAARDDASDGALVRRGLELLLPGGATPATDAIMSSVIQAWSRVARSGRGWPGTAYPQGFAWSIGRMPERITTGLVSLLDAADPATQLSVLTWLELSGTDLRVPSSVLSGLAGWWFQNPSQAEAMAHAAHYFTIRDHLIDEQLVPAIVRADAPERLRLGQIWHPVLADLEIVSFEAPLERCLAPYRYRDASPATRQFLIDLLARSMPWLKVNRLGWAWFFAVPPDPADLARLVTALGYTADPELLEYADKILEATLRSTSSSGAHPLAEALLASRATRLSPDSAAFVTRVKDAQWAMRTLESRSADSELVQQALQILTEESEAQPSALPETTQLAIHLWQWNPALVGAYLSRPRDDQFAGLISFVEQEWRRDARRRNRTFLHALYVLNAGDRDLHREYSQALRTALATAVERLSEEEYQGVRRAVFEDGAAGDKWLEAWDQLVKSVGAGRRMPSPESGRVRAKELPLEPDAPEGRWWKRRK